MTLLTPIWLLLLVPWGVVCLWTGRASGAATRVPFLAVWPRYDSQARSVRRPPPGWALLVLSGVAMMILAAAGPALRPKQTAKPLGGNARIERFTVTPSPTAMAMIRVSNSTARTAALLRVDGTATPITLPGPRQTGDFFVTLPSLGETTEARLETASGGPWVDDDPADDSVILKQTAVPARVEPLTPVSDVLAKMVAVYARHRLAGDNAPSIAIVRGDAPAAPAVILPTQLGPPSGGVVAVDTSHPVARGSFADVLTDVGRSTEPPTGGGWRALITTAPGSPLLAVRDTPARQVWVGFDADALADKAEYVVFWTDVFDWLGGGSPEWKPLPPATSAQAAAAPVPAAATLAAWPLAAGLVLAAAGLVVGYRLTGF